MTPPIVDTSDRPVPACHGMLERKVRLGLWIYRKTGFVGECVAAAAAYVVHIEGELARREAMDELRREAAEAFR